MEQNNQDYPNCINFFDDDDKLYQRNQFFSGYILSEYFEDIIIEICRIFENPITKNDINKNRPYYDRIKLQTIDIHITNKLSGSLILEHIIISHLDATRYIYLQINNRKNTKNTLDKIKIMEIKKIVETCCEKSNICYI